MKFCKDCKYYKHEEGVTIVKSFFGLIVHHYPYDIKECDHPCFQDNGMGVYTRESRYDRNLCGMEARWFEPKEKIKKIKINTSA